MNRRSTVILLGAVLFVAAVTLTFAEFALGLARFNTEDGASVSVTELTVVAGAKILRLPLVSGNLDKLQFLGPTGYSPFDPTSLRQAIMGLGPRLILNSLLWAFVASRLLRRLRKAMHRPVAWPIQPAEAH